MQYVDIAVSIAFHTEFARKIIVLTFLFRLPLDEMEKQSSCKCLLAKSSG